MKDKKKHLIRAGVLTLIFPTAGILYLCGVKEYDRYLDNNLDEKFEPKHAGVFTGQVDMTIRLLSEAVIEKRIAHLECKQLKFAEKYLKIEQKLKKLNEKSETILRDF